MTSAKISPEENLFYVPLNDEMQPNVEILKEEIMQHKKIRIGFKISKNYNSVEMGIEDEPMVFLNEVQFRQEIRKIAKILREEAERQLSLIGVKEI